jgi:hypothetical protein
VQRTAAAGQVLGFPTSYARWSAPRRSPLRRRDQALDLKGLPGRRFNAFTARWGAADCQPDRIAPLPLPLEVTAPAGIVRGKPSRRDRTVLATTAAFGVRAGRQMVLISGESPAKEQETARGWPPRWRAGAARPPDLPRVLFGRCDEVFYSAYQSVGGGRDRIEVAALPDEAL